MVFSLNSVFGFSSTSTPGMATLGLWLVCHCPVGGHMRHQQLVARNLGMRVKKVFFTLEGKSHMLPMVQNWVPGGHSFT